MRSGESGLMGGLISLIEQCGHRRFISTGVSLEMSPLKASPCRISSAWIVEGIQGGETERDGQREQRFYLLFVQ